GCIGGLRDERRACWGRLLRAGGAGRLRLRDHGPDAGADRFCGHHDGRPGQPARSRARSRHPWRPDDSPRGHAADAAASRARRFRLRRCAPGASVRAHGPAAHTRGGGVPRAPRRRAVLGPAVAVPVTLIAALAVITAAASAANLTVVNQVTTMLIYVVLV